MQWMQHTREWEMLQQSLQTLSWYTYVSHLGTWTYMHHRHSQSKTVRRPSMRKVSATSQMLNHKMIKLVTANLCWIGVPAVAMQTFITGSMIWAS